MRKIKVKVSRAATGETFGGGTMEPLMASCAIVEGLKVPGRKAPERPPLRTGEIARIRSVLDAFPAVLCRVTMASTDFVHFAVGDIRMGCAWNSIEVLARNQTEPFCWEEEEIKILKAHVELYRCSDCRKLLQEKEAKIRSMCV